MIERPNSVLAAYSLAILAKKSSKANDLPMVFPLLFDYLDNNDMDYLAYYSLPAELTKSGITVALNHHYIFSTSEKMKAAIL